MRSFQPRWLDHGKENKRVKIMNILSIYAAVSIEDEKKRIDAETVEGDLEFMISRDIWAQNGVLDRDAVDRYALDQGWLQEGFTGMEIVDG